MLPAITDTTTIGGSVLVGSTLTAQITGLPSDATVSYQWKVSDSVTGPFTSLVGEASATLLLTSDHIGKYIRMVVTPINGIYGGTLITVTYSRVTYPDDPAPPIPSNWTSAAMAPSTPHRTAEKGVSVTLTINLNGGYVLKDLTVADSNGKTVKLTQKGGNQ